MEFEGTLLRYIYNFINDKILLKLYCYIMVKYCNKI